MQEMIELAKRRNDESGIMLFLWILIGVKQGAKKVSLRSMAVLSSRAQDRRSREIRARSARERAAKPREK